ncbi:MAG: ABC transporter permease [Candidatus Krumholzibacteriia bacterium]
MASPALALIRKDLLRQVRDTRGLLIYLAAPLLLTVIMGLAFGGGVFGNRGLSAIPVALSGGDLPDNLKTALADALQKSGFFTVTWTDTATAGRLVERGKVQASLVLPDGLVGAFFRGEDVVLHLDRDPNSPIKAGVVELALTGALRQYQASEAAYRALWPDSLIDLDTEAGPLADVFSGDPRRIASALRRNPDAVRTGLLDQLDRSAAFGEAVGEPRITLEVHDRHDWDAAAQDAAPTDNLYDLFLPAFAVFFMMWGAAAVVRELHRERENRTLARLLCGPVSVTTITLGKWVAAVITGSAQLLALLLCGGVLFQVNIWHAPLAILLVTVAAGAAAASVYLVLGLLVRTEKALDSLTTVFTLVSGMLGGNFFPADAMSPTLQFFGRGTFNYWANRAFSEIITHGRGLAAVLPELLALVMVATVGLIVALALFGLRQRKGVAA